MRAWSTFGAEKVGACRDIVSHNGYYTEAVYYPLSSASSVQ
jgi:hypothetical protein